MRKKLMLLFLSLILVTSFSIALELPPEPMAFYGEVTYNGNPIPNGYHITAKINDNINGECKIINGDYGKGSESCVIISYETGQIIDFYIGNIKIGSHAFEEKELVNLNFIVDELPSDFTPLSDGVCDVEYECSYNLLDCDASVTDACAGNGVCDADIGETCVFTPEDCGVCPTDDGDDGGNPSSSSNNNNNGGGGGGGSSPSNNEVINSYTNVISSSNNETETLGASNEETTNPGITGAAVGLNSKLGRGLLILAIIIVVLVLAYFLIVKRKRNMENSALKNIKKNAERNKRAAIASMKSSKVSAKKASSKKKTVKKKAVKKVSKKK